MANFVFDSFTGASGEDLSLHTGETGATWTKHPTALSGATGVQGDELLPATGSDSFYYASGSPATAEYDITVPLRVANLGVQMSGGAFARLDTVALTGYLARYNVTGWEIQKVVAGAWTELGSYAQTLTDGQVYTLRFEVRNATKKLFVDGVERVSTVDNSIAAAGKAGVQTYTGGAGVLALRDFTASDVVVAATATTNTGPSSGTVGVASSNFTAGADGAITGTVIVTPSDGGGGGTFTPTTVSISSGTPTSPYTYTAASPGAKTITTTNDGGLSNPAPLTYTANAAGDTTNPTITGSITPSAISSSGFTFAWPAGSDNVAVTGYEYSLNGGSSWTDAGNVLTKTVSGLTASTAYSVQVRPYDAAGNRALTPLSATITTSAAPGAGTITTPQPLKNNTATVQPNLTGLVAQVLLGSSGAPVVSKTGQTTNSSGFLAVTDASIVPGTAYFLAFIDPATGAAGITNKVTAV